MKNYKITVEAENRDQYGNEFTGVSIAVEKDGEDDKVLVWLKTEDRGELTDETDRQDIMECKDEILEQAEELWWLGEEELKELEELLMNF